jgi:hypothetical protein
MVVNGTWNGRAITISDKPNCLTVSIQGELGVEVMSYDLTGRLWTAMLEEVSYRRGLDGKIVAKWVEAGREGVWEDRRGRRWLEAGEALAVEERLRKQVEALYQGIQAGEVALDGRLAQSAQTSFERSIAFDTDRSKEDAARYHQVYKPVGILPPDQYMAVVLQATEGCAFNTCTYCQFYRDRPFRIKDSSSFLEHALAVKEYLGGGLSLRRTIFFGDANSLTAPIGLLLPLFEVAHQVYDVEALGGIYAFLDGFSGVKKTAQDYRALVTLGLQRAYIGLESGNASLLKFLKKPGKPEDAVQAVRAIKAGGAAVGVIVLLGAGGRSYAREHIKDTIRVLNAMQLDLNDIIYFSELIESEGMPYVQDAYRAGLQRLSRQERIEQGQQIEKRLKFSHHAGTPHISRYDIREFVY